MNNRLKHTGALLSLATVLASTSLYGQTPSGLDAGFGAGGKVITEFGGTTSGDWASGVAVQPDGKVVAAGQTNVNGPTDFALARYYPNGTLDPSFGTGGKVITDFAGSNDGARSVAMQPDGKIVAGGWTVANGLIDFALARYNSDGTLDPSFGMGGKVITGFGVTAQGFATAVGLDGKIVVAGYANIDWGYQFALARYNSDGTLDASFGTGGKVTTPFGDPGDSSAIAWSIAIQRDGKIVTAGADNSGLALARYNSDGTLDAGFGMGGRVTAYSLNRTFAVALQPDGRIVAAGQANYSDFGLVRYNSNGSLDFSFGAGGRVTTDFAGSRDLAFAVAVRTDGKIVAAGQSFVSSSSPFAPNSDFALARYNSDGSLDPSFGTGGKATTEFAGLADQAMSVAIQPDGKAVAAGSANVNGNSKFGLARYQ